MSNTTNGWKSKVLGILLALVLSLVGYAFSSVERRLSAAELIVQQQQQELATYRERMDNLCQSVARIETKVDRILLKSGS